MSLLKVAQCGPVAVVLMVFGLQLWACTLPLAWSAVVGAAVFFCGSVVASASPQPQRDLRKRVLNETLDLIMGLQSGITAYAWVLHRNIGHHGHFLEQHPSTGDGPIDQSAWTRADRVRGALGYDMGEPASHAGAAWRWPQGQEDRSGSTGDSASCGSSPRRWWRLAGKGPIFVVLHQVMALLTFEATYDHHSGLYTEDPMEECAASSRFPTSPGSTSATTPRITSSRGCTGLGSLSFMPSWNPAFLRR